MKGLKAHALGSLPPPPPQPNRAERCINQAINDEGTIVKPGSRACAIVACDSFSLAASATPCSNAPKWAIIVSCVNSAGYVNDGKVDNSSKQVEELGLSVLR